MKNPSTHLYLAGAAIVLLLQACGSLETGPTEPVQPEVEAPVEQALLQADTSNLPTGSAMRWFDHNILIYHQGGEFQLGDDSESDDSTTLDDFWIYRFNVTNDMYRACVHAGACTPPAGAQTFLDDFDPELKDHPVVNVTWEQAESYCGWMGLRLPSAAEWQVASRGSTDPGDIGSMHPWGEADPTCELANLGSCRGKTTGVMDYPAGQSASSVFDMAGNVLNWTEDGLGKERVIKGSSFNSSLDEPEPNLIASLSPGEFGEDLGFRCAIAAIQFQGIQASEDIQDARLVLPGFNPSCQVPANVSQVPAHPACEELAIVETDNCNMANTGQGGVDFQVVLTGDEIVWWRPNPVMCTYSQDAGWPHIIAGTCFGPMGGTAHLKVCTQCTPEFESLDLWVPTGPNGSPPSGLPDEGPECSQGYVWQDDACRVVVPPPNFCPDGMEMNEANQCCRFATQFEPPNPCWLGFYYDESTDMCVSQADLYPPLVDCQVIDLELAACSQSPGTGGGGSDCNLTCKPPAKLDKSTCECTTK